MIRLEPFEPEDFDRLMGWVDSERALVQFAGSILSWPLDVAQLQEYLADPTRQAFRVCAIADNRVVGHAELVQVSLDECKIARVLIGDKADRGKGYGSSVIRQLIVEAKSRKGLSKVSLNVFSWNDPAIRCYQNLGFRDTGIRKTVRVGAEEWESIRMEWILRK